MAEKETNDFTDGIADKQPEPIINQSSMRKRAPNMATKRSIRDIKRENNDNKKNDGTPKFADERRFASRRYKSAGRGKIAVIAGSIVGFILLILISGNFTHSANLTVETNSYQVDVESIPLDPESDFAVQTITVSETKMLPAMDTETVKVPAEGSITVVNTTDSSQRLIAKTRFQAPNGTIYRTPNAITIPAKSELKGVKVVADQPGELGNQAVDGRLSIPGLVGTELENNLYATTTTGFTGGFSGTRAIPDPEDAAQVVQDLKTSLKNNYNELAKALLGEGKILVDIISDFTYSDEISGESADQATVKVQASAEAVVINQDVLIRKLAEASGANLVYSENLMLLNQGLIDFNLNDENELEFSTNPELGYQLVATDLIDQIAGLGSNQVEELLGSNSAITDYELVVSPFWRTSVPNNPDKIEVVIKGQDTLASPDIQPLDQSSDSDTVVEDNGENDDETEEDVVRIPVEE